MTATSPSLLYIHGFNSSPESHKARQLQAAFGHLGLAEGLRVPALHHHPRQAIAQLERAIAELGRPVLVGSSLGGYYATHLAERHGLAAILVNPAVAPHRSFDGYLGAQTNHYSGETWELTEDHMAALAELEVTHLQRPERYQVWLPSTEPARYVSRPAATTVSRASPGSCRRCWRSPATRRRCGATPTFRLLTE